MKAAVLGKGGREHALARRLAEDLGESSVVVVPGNPGIFGSTGDLPAGTSLGDALAAREVELVVVGPEALLAEGVADTLRAAGFAVVGPSKEAARLETEKTFAKAFLARHRIPTARSVVLESATDDALLDAFPASSVVKFDGLAEGKGVVVCDDAEATRAAVLELRERYGQNARLLVEERLVGPELSVMLLVADGHAVVLPESRDHKRLLDADHGPNTGGMGAFSPVLDADDPLHARIADEIVGPTVRGLVTDGLAYRGFLYVGLMLTPEGPKVLEFNVRFGDPEAQAVLPRIDGNFAELCLACAKGTLAGKIAAPRAIHALAVVLAREGYPRAPLGEPVRVTADLAPRDTSHVCVASSRKEGDTLLLPQGRVLGVVGLGPTREAAKVSAYARVAELSGPGLVYRRDIGGLS